MINIITHQIDGNKSKSNLSTHHQAYVCEGFSHNNPSTLFENINCFSTIDGYVYHIMKVLEDSTPHLHIFDFFNTTQAPCFENMPTTKVDGNLIHTPYNPNKDTYVIKSP
jgi:hypothetical protein